MKGSLSKHGPRPRVSVISSCYEGTWIDALDRVACGVADWDPGGKRSVDLYVFSANDRKWLLKTLGSPTSSSETITELLARATDDDVERLATEIADRCLRHKMLVPAFATHIPALSSPCEEHRCRAQNALANICRLAWRLNDMHGLGTTVVEFVGGPRVGWHDRVANGATGRRLHVGAGATAARFQALVRSWSGVISQTRDTPVGLAIEIEPWLSYLARDIGTVDELVDGVKARLGQKHEDCCRVGINLDMGHLNIHDAAFPGTSLLVALSEPTWSERIMHAHISHHPVSGHFADLSLACPGSEALKPWVSFYIDLLRRSCRNPFLTGAISVELEMSSSAFALPRAEAAVEESVTVLQKWIGGDRQRHGVGSDAPTVIDAVVLFADIKGSTELLLSGRNQQERETILKSFARAVAGALPGMQDCVVKHQGVFDKFMGDALLAYWPLKNDESQKADAVNQALLAGHVIRGKWLEACDDNGLREARGMRVMVTAGQIALGDYGEWFPDVSALGVPVILCARLGKWEGYQDTARTLVTSSAFQLFRVKYGRQKGAAPILPRSKPTMSKQLKRLLGRDQLYMVDVAQLTARDGG